MLWVGTGTLCVYCSAGYRTFALWQPLALEGGCGPPPGCCWWWWWGPPPPPPPPPGRTGGTATCQPAAGQALSTPKQIQTKYCCFC